MISSSMILPMTPPRFLPRTKCRLVTVAPTLETSQPTLLETLPKLLEGFLTPFGASSMITNPFRTGHKQHGQGKKGKCGTLSWGVVDDALPCSILLTRKV